MRLGPNLIAGFASAIWTAVLGFAVVPLYLKYLGVEAYGLIGFFTTLQALFQLLDFGLAPTINRQIARYSASGQLPEARNLLHTLAVVYCVIGALIGATVLASAHVIANHWLQVNHLPRASVERALMLIGVVIACRWPVGIYTSALLGLQRVTVTSAISAVAMTLATLGAVGILAFVSPTIEAFFVWQALAGLMLALAMRQAAWRAVRRSTEARFELSELAAVWRFSVGMIGLALAGLTFMQLDKIVLSKILTLENFGYYSLAGTVANGLQLLIVPVFNVMFARFSALIAVEATQDVARLYGLFTRLLATVLFPIAMALAFDARDVVFVWTRSAHVAEAVAPLLRLLVLGTAIHGMMNISYALQLASGRPRIPLTINAVLLVVMVPVILVLALKYGALGGALAWLAVRVVYLLFGTWLNHRVLMKGLALRWLSRDVGIPLLLTVAIFGIGFHLYGGPERAPLSNLIFSGALALCAALLLLAISPALRAAVLSPLSSNKRSRPCASKS